VPGLIAAAQPKLSLVRLAVRGWDDHQDVWACARIG
jgi:hypothetical protein